MHPSFTSTINCLKFKLTCSVYTGFGLDRVHCKYIYFSDTSARLVEKGEEEELDHQPIPTSRLRQRAAHLITESDEKYAGKRTSRNKLNDLEQLGM